MDDPIDVARIMALFDGAVIVEETPRQQVASLREWNAALAPFDFSRARKTPYVPPIGRTDA